METKDTIVIEVISRFEEVPGSKFHKGTGIEYRVSVNGREEYRCVFTSMKIWRNSTEPLRNFDRWLFGEKPKSVVEEVFEKLNERLREAVTD
jgi:hypothetical protein